MGADLPHRSERERQHRVGHDPFAKASGNARSLLVADVCRGTRDRGNASAAVDPTRSPNDRFRDAATVG